MKLPFLESLVHVVKLPPVKDIWQLFNVWDRCPTTQNLLNWRSHRLKLRLSASKMTPLVLSYGPQGKNIAKNRGKLNTQGHIPFMPLLSLLSIKRYLRIYSTAFQHINTVTVALKSVLNWISVKKACYKYIQSIWLSANLLI